jgi:hypothetical protein
MRPVTPRNKKRRAYGWFAFACIMYTLGVAVYMTFSYHHQRNAILSARHMEHCGELLDGLLLRKLVGSAFMLIMAFPLAASYNRARAVEQKKLAALDSQLEKDFETLKERETELQDAIQDLERFNALTLGRESRIIELKAEVNTLLEQMDRKKRYMIDSAE